MAQSLDRAALEAAIDDVAPGADELKARVCSILNLRDGGCTPERIDETLTAAGAHELAARLRGRLAQES